jgi:RNA polymerase sigma-70 factor (ECF subfamily)
MNEHGGAGGAPGDCEALRVPDESDSELLRAAGHGNHSAFRALVQRHAPYLFGIAHSLVRNAHDAEDIVQETFLGAMKGGFRGEASVRTWLVRILVRRAGMLRRTRWKKSPPLSLDLKIEEGGGASPQPPVTGSDSRPAAATEAKLDLAAMLETLSPEHRQIIVLRELEGLSYDEISEALGIPRGTVESRLYRAREQLRKKFEGYL